MIPPGTYTVGSATPKIDGFEESPAHQISIPDNTYIDNTEVTNSEYHDYWTLINGDTNATPHSWHDLPYSAAEGDLPVTGIYYEYADGYCKSLGKQLPSEDVWEVAASYASPSSARSIYSFGDKKDVFKPELDKYYYPVGTQNINQSALAVYDLTGNAWEYVSKSYDETIPTNLNVVRGGQNSFLLKNTERRVGNEVEFRMNQWAGFRCAANVPNPVPPSDPPVEPAPPAALAVGSLPTEQGFLDDFRNLDNGWLRVENDDLRYGNHPLQFFHLEAKHAGVNVLATAPQALDPGVNYKITTAAMVDKSNTEANAHYEYGLAFKVSDDRKSYLAFVVDPVSHSWELLKVADGVPEHVAGQEQTVDISPEVPKNLRVDFVDQENFQLYIGDKAVRETPYNVAGFDGTAAGLFLRNYDDSGKTHIHFTTFSFVKI